MSMTLKNIAEQAARWFAAALIAVLCWLAKDTLLQLRQIQADLANIKLQLAVMEAKAMTPDTVRQLILLELAKHDSGHQKQP